MGKDSTAAGGIPLVRKDHYKSLGVTKAATAGGNGKGTGGIPLTGMDHYEIVGVNKVATAAGGDGKRLAFADGSGGVVGGAKGAARAVAVVPGGAKGAAGRRLGGASAFSSTDHSTCKTVRPRTPRPVLCILQVTSRLNSDRSRP
jgi:hypothetical protein